MPEASGKSRFSGPAQTLHGERAEMKRLGAPRDQNIAGNGLRAEDGAEFGPRRKTKAKGARQ